MKNKIIEIGKKLGAQGFAQGISGNISLRTENGMYISASGTKLSELTYDDIVITDFDGNLIEGNKKPSSEKNMHLGIYKSRNDINAIIHCHSPKATTLSACHIAMNKKLLADCVFYFGEIPLAKYAMPSSDELVKNTVPLFNTHNAVLLANHGIIVGADTIEDAYYLTETAEFNAEIYINSMILNKYKSLNKKAVDDLIKLRETK